MRELLREEHDEIAAAQDALRRAERVHDRAIELAERQLRSAKSAEPLAAYRHEVILYADRVSTADGNHELTAEVSARVQDSVLVIEGPGWRARWPSPVATGTRSTGWPRTSRRPPPSRR